MLWDRLWFSVTCLADVLYVLIFLFYFTGDECPFLKKGCSVAALIVILFDGSSYSIYVNRSIASGWFLSYGEHCFIRFSLPFTFHFGKVIFISGRS